MALKVFHCEDEDCSAEFTIDSQHVEDIEDLTCPRCGQESVAEGPAESVEDDDEEEERRPPRWGAGRYG